jgi:diadenosine tetraphosphate (Ap4A) HIT family hydrolase
MTITGDWRQQREQIGRYVEALRGQGICYSCYDLQTGAVFGDRDVIYEDDLFKVVLELFPRMKGHTIVVYKPHYEDISFMPEDDVAQLFRMCSRVARAIKQGLGVEKVYLNTMCDGGINHVHIQLLPRYAGDSIGSKRFVLERGPLVDGSETARLIRAALLIARDPQ